MSAARHVRRGAGALWRLRVGVCILLAIGLATYSTIAAVRSDRQSDARDEARKYQACEQRAEATENANVLATVTRGSLLTAHRRQSLQARKTTDLQLRERYLLGSRLALHRRRMVRISPVPQCALIYPEGRRQTDRFPDLAPTRGAGS